MNKLALDNFDRVSNKILDLDIVNDEILAAIVQLISEKAIGEVTFCAMYAKLCLKMVQVLPTKQEWIVSDANKNAFRQLLLKSCQAKFETDDKWSEGDLIAQKARVEMLKNIDKWTAEEKQEFAEQAYERLKIKMKSLGNIKFVGELYLVGLLSEKIIIDECLGKLIKKGLENNEEEDLEALCKLMVSVGQRLDSPRNQEKMNGYFTCLETLSKIESVSSRVRFMLQDVIDLRKDRWVPRVTATVSAKSLAQVKQEIREDSKKKANASKPSRRETDRYDRRPDSKGSGGFERDNRDRKRPEKQRSEDGWTSAGAGSKPANKDVRSAWGRKSQSTTSASVKVEGAKNMFQALGGEHTSPILEKAEIEAAAPEKFEVEKTPTEVIEEAVKEFKESLSPMELLSDVSDIDDPGMLKLLVSKLVYFLVERNASNSLKIFTVFESLFFYESALYDTQILIDGFKDFLVAFEEDRYDFPKAFENMAAVFIPAVEKGYLSFENLCEISEPLQNYKGRIPTRPQFAKDLFGGLSTEVEIVEFIITCQFDLKPFFCVDGKAECDEQALKTWIKNTIAKSNKAIAILESVISPVVRNTFELSGTAPTLMHSYRWFNPDADDSLVSHEKFGVWFITSLVKVVAQKCIPGCEKSQEVFRTMEQEMVKLKPLFALNSLTDTIEHRLDILIGTEQYLKSANKLGTLY